MESGKYAIDLKPAKSYKKSFVFLATLKLTIPKVFQPISFKADTSLYFNASQYSGWSHQG